MRIEQLTFTRYIAALAVVAFHFGSNAIPTSLEWLKPVLLAGPTAVSYFYVLSGFIMAIAYYQPAAPSFNRTRYWVARFARIYPVYLVALLLMIIAKLHAEGSNPLTVGLSLFALQAWVPGYPLSLNTPGWSLSVEAFFYLLFPVIVVLIKPQQFKILAFITLTLWLITQVFHSYWLSSPQYQPFSKLHDFIYYNPVLHLGTFLLGYCAGVCVKQGRFDLLSNPLLNPTLLVLATLLSVVLLLNRYPLMDTLGVRFDYNNGLLAPLFISIIVLLTLNKGWISQFLQHPWLILLGEASYSLYILQKPLHGIYEKIFAKYLDMNSGLYFYLFAVLLTISALFSYWFFETPLRHFINNFVNRKR